MDLVGDLAGNNRKRANTSAFKGLGDKSIRVRDFVGQQGTQDYFKFQLNRRSSINIALTGLDADANVALLNRKGAVIQASEQSGKKNERIQATVNADTYYVRVYKNSGNTAYNLTLSAPSNPGDMITSARKERSPSFTSKNVVSDNDTSDFYQFKVDKSGVFSANLTGLTGDADVRLIDDQNGNGKIDKGEIIAWQWERQKKSESIRKFLKSGAPRLIAFI